MNCTIISSEIECFNNNYSLGLYNNNPGEGIKYFLRYYENWKQAAEKLKKQDIKGNKIYQYLQAIANYAKCLNQMITIKKLKSCKLLSIYEEVIYYESICDFDPNIGYELFWYLGLCWIKLGMDSYAIEALKKSIYYQYVMITTKESEKITNSKAFNYIGYSFRKLETYLYPSLMNEEITLSAPYKFNDLFDCIILKLLELNRVDNEARFFLETYNDIARIRCFVRDSEKEECEKAYLNNRMWGLYGDSHCGICLRYHLNSDLISQNIGPRRIAILKEVEYSDNMMDAFDINQNSISYDKTFFLKTKEWEYENELRYLLIDRNSNDEHPKVPAHNMLSAVYFGARCSEDNKRLIMKILEGKQWVDFEGNVQPIEFYNIIPDDKKITTLNAVKITNDINVVPWF